MADQDSAADNSATVVLQSMEPPTVTAVDSDTNTNSNRGQDALVRALLAQLAASNPSASDSIAAATKGSGGGSSSGGDVHIGTRVYMAAEGEVQSKRDDVVIENGGSSSSSAHGARGDGSSGGGGGENNVMEWSKRDYVSVVVFMSVIVILLILIYLVMRPRYQNSAKPTAISITADD